MDLLLKLLLVLLLLLLLYARVTELLGMTPRQIAYRIQTMKINVRKL